MKVITKILMSLIVVFAIMGCFYAVNGKDFTISQIITEISELTFDNPIESFNESYETLQEKIDEKPMEDMNGLEKIVSYIGSFFSYLGNIFTSIGSFFETIIKDIKVIFRGVTILFGF